MCLPIFKRKKEEPILLKPLIVSDKTIKMTKRFCFNYINKETYNKLYEIIDNEISFQASLATEDNNKEYLDNLYDVFEELYGYNYEEIDIANWNNRLKQ